MVDDRFSRHDQFISATAAELTTFANDVHGYLRQNITWADQKAGFIFAASSALLGYLHSQRLFAFLRGDIPFRMAYSLIAIGASCLLMALAACFATYWPRRKGRKDGVVFWGAIATSSESPGDYVDRVRDRSAFDLADEKLRHSFELAKICNAKYGLVDLATKLAIIGFIFSAVYILFLSGS